MSWHFYELFSRKLQKVPHSVEKHDKSSIWPKLCNFFEQTTMSLHFDQLFGKKSQKVPHFVKQHEKSLIWPKLCNFWNKLQFRFPFDELSRKKLQKVRRLVKKHENSSILSTCNFPRKLPCFDVSMNIAAKSCKKLLVPWKSTKNHQFGQIFATFRTNFDVFAFRWIFKEKVKKCFVSWKSTKNHRSGQNFATFRANYHVLAFRWSFQQKVAKSASFREKTHKTIDSAKTYNFSSKLPCVGIFMNFSERSCKKFLISWKSTRNHRFRQHYATFRTNYHVFAFRKWTSREGKGWKKSFISWKSTKTHRFDKNYATFSNKLPCFGFSMNFSAKGCKRWLNSRKIIDLAKTLHLFEKLPCLWISINFSGKSCKKCLISLKSTKNHRFGQIFITFRTNYHVLAFRWTFQEKVAKSAWFRGNAREIIDLAKTLKVFEQTTRSLYFDELFRKKFQKVPHFVKKHKKPSIWQKLATFRANYHVLAFSWTFQKEVAKSSSFRERAREIIDFANTMQLFEQTTMFLHFDELLRKRLEKVVHFVKKDEIMDFVKTCKRKTHGFGQNLQLFEQTTMFWCFDELFSKRLQKVAQFAKKHEKSSIWPKPCNFSNNYHVFGFRWTFQEKVGKSASFRKKARKIIDLAKSL